jgi:hypothetical protein
MQAGDDGDGNAAGMDAATVRAMSMRNLGARVADGALTGQGPSPGSAEPAEPPAMKG